MKIIKLLLIFVLLAGNIVLLLNWNAVFKSGFKAERKEWDALMEQVVRLVEENGSLKNQLKEKDNEEVAAAEAERLEAERLEAAKKKAADAEKEEARAIAKQSILEMVNRENTTIADIRKSDAWKRLTEKEKITVEIIKMNINERYNATKYKVDADKKTPQLKKEVEKALKESYSSFEDMEKTQLEIQRIEMNYHYAKK